MKWPWTKPEVKTKQIKSAEEILGIKLINVTYERLELQTRDSTILTQPQEATIGSYYVTYDDGSTKVLSRDVYHQAMRPSVPLKKGI